MQYELINNKINQQYVKTFVEKELTRRNVSDRRKIDVFNRLKLILNEICPNRDIKTINRKEAEEIALKLVKRYKKYWAVSSYIQTFRQFIRYLFELEDGDKLPIQFKPIKTPPMKSYTNVYRDESRLIQPEEAFNLVSKNARNKREAFVFMLLMDLGLRPHELLRAKRKDIVIDKLYRWYFKVSDDTKTGKREVMIIYAIPYVDEYLKTLNKSPDTPLFPYSDQMLYKIISRISKNKCSPYDLRASSMSYFSLFLTDQELKARYGSEEYKHYVRLNREKLANKLDQLAGRNGNGQEIDSLKQIAPHFCIYCQNYTDKSQEVCRVCKRLLDPSEEIKREKMDRISYECAKEFYEINPKRFIEIAKSFGVRIT